MFKKMIMILVVGDGPRQVDPHPFNINMSQSAQSHLLLFLKHGDLMQQGGGMSAIFSFISST